MTVGEQYMEIIMLHLNSRMTDKTCIKLYAELKYLFQTNSLEDLRFIVDKDPEKPGVIIKGVRAIDNYALHAIFYEGKEAKTISSNT